MLRAHEALDDGPAQGTAQDHRNGRAKHNTDQTEERAQNDPVKITVGQTDDLPRYRRQQDLSGIEQDADQGPESPKLRQPFADSLLILEKGANLRAPAPEGIASDGGYYNAQ